MELGAHGARREHENISLPLCRESQDEMFFMPHGQRAWAIPAMDETRVKQKLIAAAVWIALAILATAIWH
jgi:hypothetical protein